MRNSFIQVTTISCTLGHDKGATESISRAHEPYCRTVVMYSRSCQHAQVSLYSMNCVQGDTTGPVRYLIR